MADVGCWEGGILNFSQEEMTALTPTVVVKECSSMVILGSIVTEKEPELAQ